LIEPFETIMEVSQRFHTKIQSRNIWIAAKMEIRPKQKISEL
jgi:vancomycin permeability regulator SanA